MLLLSIILMLVTILTAGISLFIESTIGLVILAVIGNTTAAIAIVILIIELIKKNRKSK